MLTGLAAMSDWTSDAPGVRRKITVDDLPPPNNTRSADNGPDIVVRPNGAQLHVPPGFKIEQYASGLRDPRFLLTAPNGDLFVVEAGPIRSRSCATRTAMVNRTGPSFHRE